MRPYYAGLRISEVVGLDLADVRLSAHKGELRIRGTGREAVGLGDDPTEPFSPHVLRHTFATQLIRDSTDPILVAELLGHDSLDTTRRIAVVEEFLEQDAVVHHGLAQVLGGGLAWGGASADLVGLAVVVQGTAVHHWQVRQLLPEVFGGISALGHDGGDQFVGLGDGGTWSVDEPLLQRGPLPGVGLPGGGGERRDVQGGEAFLRACSSCSASAWSSRSVRECSYPGPKRPRRPCRRWRSKT
ncbi:site-specific integrase [Nonomuraea angiospora]|uniref:site-specific integrase n=1 Tax=Nonomuraea angiospora TaxID=46172 RepID=UPI003411F7C0